jgi:hypothetical protein
MSLQNVLSVPLEAVSPEGNISFVFKRDWGKIVKQEVETGAMNDTHIVIVKGLNENDEVLLVPPAVTEGLQVNRITTGDNVTPKDAPASKPVQVNRDSSRSPTTPASQDSGKK